MSEQESSLNEALDYVKSKTQKALDLLEDQNKSMDEASSVPLFSPTAASLIDSLLD